MSTTFHPRFAGDSAAFQTMEERVIALGLRQRRQRAAMLRLSAWCRERELAGDTHKHVAAVYRRALRRINRATDIAGAGFAPGLPLAPG
jgi:hypothetical protein